MVTQKFLPYYFAHNISNTKCCPLILLMLYLVISFFFAGGGRMDYGKLTEALAPSFHTPFPINCIMIMTLSLYDLTISLLIFLSQTNNAKKTITKLKSNAFNKSKMFENEY